MKIKLSASAIRDIEGGCDFYGSIDPALAINFYDSISADIDSLHLNAGIHASVDGWHYTFASRFPFVIWYAVKDGFAVVYAVLDGRRDPTTNEAALRQRRRHSS